MQANPQESLPETRNSAALVRFQSWKLGLVSGMALANATKK